MASHKRFHRIVALALAATLVVGLFAGAVGVAMADELDDQRAAAEQNKRKKDAQRSQLETSLTHTDARLKKATLDLNTVEARLPLAQSELADAEAEAERAEREAVALAGRLSDAQTEEQEASAAIDKYSDKADDARVDVARMARESVRTKGQVSTLGIVTGAQSMEDFMRAHSASSSAARSQSRVLEEVQEAEATARNAEARLTAIRETIAGLKDAADQAAVDANAARDRAAARKAEVDRLITEQTTLKVTIEGERDQTIEQLKQAEKESQDWAIEIKRLAAEQKERDRRIEEQRRKEEAERKRKEEEERKAREAERLRQAEILKHKAAAARKAADEAKAVGAADAHKKHEEAQHLEKKATEVAKAKPAPVQASSSGSGSAFISWPTSGRRITSPYGWRTHPIRHVRAFHYGIDIGDACGTPIYAPNSGIVIGRSWMGGGGNTLSVDHGKNRSGSNIKTRYMHLSSYAVGNGAMVSKGQLLGRVGTTGGSTGCHLHFEVLVNNNHVNPLSVLP
ncbi:MAG: peptidoglycan DD-metalloendopeptidase family protein [Cellulomonadaceae bacterium]|jgi:murein DD-endopeptidase MepM/ murein hydrolase activator NlpD|nr:peptidoglycan DD-metalloendopeptidase family protein [Cellulomonadaceae bacterium]